MPESPSPSLSASCGVPYRGKTFRLAAPSFVLPAPVAENCRFLAHKVDEIGLLFFETEACLNYTDEDLPPWLAELPVAYHVHLPLDLDWSAPSRAFEQLGRLVQKAAFLSPSCYVLHPHENAPPEDIARRFAGFGVEPERVLLENTEERSLAEDWPAIMASGLSACLDIGHVLAYSQRSILELPGLWERVRMVHASAPHPKNPARHAGLNMLDEHGAPLLQTVLDHLSDSATLMIEVFEEKGFFDSLAHVHQLNQEQKS